MDELSMIGRQMLGKIEFKLREVLGNTPGPDGEEVFLGSRDAVMAGDPKHARRSGMTLCIRKVSTVAKGRTSLVAAMTPRRRHGARKELCAWG